MSFLEKLKAIPAENKVDIGAYYRIIREGHEEPRLYSITSEAVNYFAELVNNLQLIE